MGFPQIAQIFTDFCRAMPDDIGCSGMRFACLLCRPTRTDVPLTYDWH